MTEYDRIKKEAVFHCCSEINGDAPNCKRELCPICSSNALHCSFKIPRLEQAITQILSLDGIEIRSKDQSLPSVRNAVNKSYNDYMLGQEDMLKEGFVKVIPKGR